MNSQVPKNANGEFRPGNAGKPPEIGVRPGALFPALRFCHEVGHLLSRYGFGNGYSAETHSDFAEWRAAVNASDAIDKIKKAPIFEKDREYFLSDEEKFAAVMRNGSLKNQTTRALQPNSSWYHIPGIRGVSGKSTIS